MAVGCLVKARAMTHKLDLDLAKMKWFHKVIGLSIANTVRMEKVKIYSDQN